MDKTQKEKAAAMHEATDIGTKLTEAQMRELMEIGKRNYRSFYDDAYKPIRRLLALGLVDRQMDPKSLSGAATYAITEAGSALLRSLQSEEPSNG